MGRVKQAAGVMNSPPSAAGHYSARVDSRWRPIAEFVPLQAGEIHVVRASLDPSDGRIAELSDLITSDERKQAGRFVREIDQRRFVAARGTLRTLLGSYVGRDPKSLRFVTSVKGKPSLSPIECSSFSPGSAGQGSELFFNLSHSGEWALFAFSRDRELGVDVEKRRKVDAIEVAESVFSSAELEALRALGGAERDAAFFRGWARKEAFVKATGEGVSQLGDFDVRLDAGEGELLLGFAGDEGGAPRYSLIDLPGVEGYAASLAYEEEAAISRISQEPRRGPLLRCYLL